MCGHGVIFRRSNSGELLSKPPYLNLWFNSFFLYKFVFLIPNYKLNLGIKPCNILYCNTQCDLQFSVLKVAYYHLIFINKVPYN